LGKSLAALKDMDGALDAFRSAKALMADADLAPGEAQLLDRLEAPDFVRELSTYA
jgi:hypothetical protein